jgi:hypothetical protein
MSITHPLQLLKRSILLIGGMAVGVYFQFRRLFVRAPTKAELRRIDKAKRREIRRKLRGLDPETIPQKNQA